MSMMEALRSYIGGCPQLQDQRLNVDFLDSEINSYSIDQVPASPIIQRYVDGATRNQLLFVISSRSSYGAEIRQNLDNIGFYEDFADWLKEQMIQYNLPVFGDRKTAQKIEALTHGYAFDADENTARYQIQCRVIYLQE